MSDPRPGMRFEGDNEELFALGVPQGSSEEVAALGAQCCRTAAATGASDPAATGAIAAATGAAGASAAATGAIDPAATGAQAPADDPSEGDVACYVFLAAAIVLWTCLVCECNLAHRAEVRLEGRVAALEQSRNRYSTALRVMRDRCRDLEQEAREGASTGAGRQ